VWYAPTLPRLPGGAEKWMFERFLAQGIAIAGIDVGESYGSPTGRKSFTALYNELTTKRNFSKKPVLLARSRGGLMLYCWAAENADKVGGVAGIYPVCNIASYPGLKRACGAYGMTEAELKTNLAEHNPIDRLASLAKAKVPIMHIHGDSDKVVPHVANSAIVAERYKTLGGPVEIILIEGQGHNMWSGWFTSQKVTDFIIAQATGRPVSAVPQPIAHWTLDDDGEVARDAVGNHHGKIVGAKPAGGRLGKSLEFVRAEGNHIEIPYSADFAISTFTVSAWVNLTKDPTFSGVLGTRFGGDQTFDMKVNAAKVHGDIGDGTKWIETAVNFYADDKGSNGQGGDLPLDRWFHIVFVIDSEVGACRLYLDADLKKTIPFKGKPVLMTPKHVMHIGHSSGTEFMDGMIDDVKIWNQVLSTDQVKALYDAAGQ
jgi:hypothetical protein